MKLPALLLAFLALAGCGGVPRDQQGTLERIAEMQEVRVGVIAAAAQSPHFARLRDFVERSSAAAGGRPRVEDGTAEALLLRLEAGQLDLVVGEFDRASPWYRRVHLLPPIATRSEGDSEIEATAAARNGENGWIMLIEREARALSTPS
ncbi:hypothetical protein [Sphingosinicella sp. YJ22]|uniref:hypothetical protein n=1 Tax=Sphingosinicella sp. YJ22 TaxID=1104780 RepID=UPI00140B31C6|nr:hypothetical protein [Sphingosinicella sp. YJ22]